MDDARIWGSETGLWTADPDHYREIIASDALMVLPDAPYVFTGDDAVRGQQDATLDLYRLLRPAGVPTPGRLDRHRLWRDRLQWIGAVRRLLHDHLSSPRT